MTENSGADCSDLNAVKEKFRADGPDAQNQFFRYGRLNEGLETLRSRIRAKNNRLEGALPDAPKVQIEDKEYFLPTYKFPKACASCTPESVMGAHWPANV